MARIARYYRPKYHCLILISNFCSRTGLAFQLQEPRKSTSRPCRTQGAGLTCLLFSWTDDQPVYLSSVSMIASRQMVTLALALCLCHASAFAGVISARGSISQGGLQQMDQRLANAAVPRCLDGGDLLGESFYYCCRREICRPIANDGARLGQMAQGTQLQVVAIGVLSVCWTKVLVALMPSSSRCSE